MGVLGVNGSGDGSQHVDPPDAEEAAPAAEGQPRDEAGQFVPAEKLVPETQESRRERKFQERVQQYVKPIEERFTGEISGYKQQLEEERRARNEQAQALANLRGQIEAMQRQPAQRQEAAPQGPDPDKLFAEADAALQANDYVTHKAKERQAYMALAAKQANDAARAVREEMQRSQQSQLPQHIQVLLAQHPNVAAAGPKGAREVGRAREDLMDEGMQPGYALDVEAFKRASEKLAPKAKPTAPTYSRESASALSGVPTGSRAPAGGRAEGGYTPNEAERAAIKAGNFKDAEEFYKWKDPHKYGLVKQ